MELRKVRMAIDMGAESIMDLSNYGKTNTFRKQLIDMSPVLLAGDRLDLRRDDAALRGIHLRCIISHGY